MPLTKIQLKLLTVHTISLQNPFGIKKIQKIEEATAILISIFRDVLMSFLENASQVGCQNWNEIKTVAPT